MPFEFKLPDLGEGIHEAQVLAWKVRPGQEVAAFQPLCEVESAKAAVELTAPVAGRVLETRFAEGAVARRGDVLVVIDTDGDGEWFGIVGSAPAARPKPAEQGGLTNRVRAAPFVRKLARERGVPLEVPAASGAAPPARCRRSRTTRRSRRYRSPPARRPAAPRPLRQSASPARGQPPAPSAQPLLWPIPPRTAVGTRRCPGRAGPSTPAPAPRGCPRRDRAA